MLKVIDASIDKLLDYNNRTFNESDRLEYFMSLNKSEFSRKDYMDVFKDISSSTATRDLKKGLELNLFDKIREKSKTKYIITEHNKPLNLKTCFYIECKL